MDVLVEQHDHISTLQQGNIVNNIIVEDTCVHVGKQRSRNVIYILIQINAFLGKYLPNMIYILVIMPD